MLFIDRHQAGYELVDRALKGFSQNNSVVLAIPRGGIPVADRISEMLRAPLDVVVVRKITLVDQPEIGIGAVAEGGEVVWDDQVVKKLNLGKKELEKLIQDREVEVEEMVEYTGGRFL